MGLPDNLPERIDKAERKIEETHRMVSEIHEIFEALKPMLSGGIPMPVPVGMVAAPSGFDFTKPGK